MATYSSKHAKRQDMINLALVLVSIVLVSVLVGSEALDRTPFNFQTSPVQVYEGAVSGIGLPSFAMDGQYWDAHCSHGWSADETCDNIVLRAQACLMASASSTYCSDYKKYMQQLH